MVCIQFEHSKTIVFNLIANNIILFLHLRAWVQDVLQIPKFTDAEGLVQSRLVLAWNLCIFS